MTPKVAIVGATTWGTALGIILARDGALVRLLARTRQEASQLNSERRNVRFLPHARFPDVLTVTSDAREAIALAELVIIAVPSDQFRPNVRSIREEIAPDAIVLSATKGLELPAGERMSQVLRQELPTHLHSNVCVLSGPQPGP